MRIIASLFVAFALLVPAQAQEEYRLRAGDTIEVTVFQEPDLGRQVVVRPDGRISFPLVGHLNAAGRTIPALEADLKERLQTYYKGELDVTILLAQAYAPPPLDPAAAAAAEAEKFIPLIYVTGEVNSPGEFQIEYRTTVLQGIAKAGGLAPYAAKGRIQIRRRIGDQDVVFPFDYEEVERGYDLTGNIYLEHGDVIVVPERGLFE